MSRARGSDCDDALSQSGDVYKCGMDPSGGADGHFDLTLVPGQEVLQASLEVCGARWECLDISVNGPLSAEESCVALQGASPGEHSSLEEFQIELLPDDGGVERHFSPVEFSLDTRACGCEDPSVPDDEVAGTIRFMAVRCDPPARGLCDNCGSNDGAIFYLHVRLAACPTR